MRATVDLDDPSDLDVITAWHRLRGFGEGRVYGRVSSSGHGVHLKVHGCQKDEAHEARLLCGDDTKRLRFDEDSRLKPKQILFSSKPTGEGASDWTQDLEEVLDEYRRRCPAAVRYPDAPMK